MDPNAFMVGGGMQMQQRPQPQPDQHHNELAARIVQELAKTPIHTGWQATLDPRTRAACILNLLVLRLLQLLDKHPTDTCEQGESATFAEQHE
jgi:hypothetical protein